MLWRGIGKRKGRHHPGALCELHAELGHGTSCPGTLHLPTWGMASGGQALKYGGTVVLGLKEFLGKNTEEL